MVDRSVNATFNSSHNHAIFQLSITTSCTRCTVLFAMVGVSMRQ